jgi:hypothetical protein
MVSCSKGRDTQARGAVYGLLHSASPSAGESKFLSLVRFRRLLLGLLPACLLGVVPAEAGIIKFEFEAEVTGSDSSAIAAGDLATGEFVYDSDAVTGSFPVMPGTAYDIAPDSFVIKIEIGAFSFSTSGFLDLFLLNDSPADSLVPLAEAGGLGTSPVDFVPGEILLTLDGTSDFLLVTGDLLPESPSQIDPAEIISGGGQITSGAGGTTPGSINFSVLTESVRVSAVPEPTSLALIGLGLAGMASVRRRSRS